MNKLISSIFSLFAIIIPSTYSLNQLSFSGGGSFGAVEIGILEKLQEIENKSYDYYTGISAGGINTGYLSHFEDINEGIKNAKNFYSTIKNREIYKLYPKTNISLLNTEPLKNTINKILSKTGPSIKESYIGTTNLYTGNLDIYRYDELESIDDRTNLLLSTSAIPVIFPPIYFKGNQYVDGGTLQNELLNLKHDESYLNITFITVSDSNIYNNTKINSMKQLIVRLIIILKTSFNNEYNKININCDKINGEINRYYVNSSLLENYNMLNFDKGKELIKIGYENIMHEKIYIC